MGWGKQLDKTNAVLTKAMQFCLPTAAKVENISNMVEFNQDVCIGQLGNTVVARRSELSHLAMYFQFKLTRRCSSASRGNSFIDICLFLQEIFKKLFLLILKYVLGTL